MTDSAIYEETLSSGSPTAQHPERTPMLSKHKANLKTKHLTNLGMGMSSTPLVVEDRLLRLKQEFNRCLADQREKRQEIMRLREQISSQAEEINSLKLEENRALIEINTCKENAERLANKLKLTETELERLRRLSKSHANEDIKATKSDNLEERLNQMQKENESFRQNCDHLHETIKELEDERDRIEEKYRKLRVENEKLMKKLESSTVCEQCLGYERGKFLLKDAQQECQRLKNMYIQVCNDKDELARDLAESREIDVSKELGEQKMKTSKLERDLQVAEMKCTELSKMLEKEKVDCERRIEELKANFGSG